MKPLCHKRMIAILCLVLSCSTVASYRRSEAASARWQVRLAQQEHASSIKLTMEQEHVIKEIVLKELKTERAPADLAVKIGDPVPQGVSVQPFPAEVSGKVPQIKTHVFFIKGEQIIVVDPKDNKVADIID
jgi:hypothetical protein